MNAVPPWWCDHFCSNVASSLLFCGLSGSFVYVVKCFYYSVERYFKYSIYSWFCYLSLRVVETLTPLNVVVVTRHDLIVFNYTTVLPLWLKWVYILRNKCNCYLCTTLCNDEGSTVIFGIVFNIIYSVHFSQCEWKLSVIIQQFQQTLI